MAWKTVETKRTEAKIAAVKEDIASNPNKLETEQAKDHGLNKMDMSYIVREDLRMKGRAVAKVQLLTVQQRQKRLERSKKILNLLKWGNSKVLIFSDEKIFTVDAVGNPRTKEYIAKSPQDVPPEVRS